MNDMRQFLTIREETIRHFKRKMFHGGGYRLPRIGVYYPSVLAQSCLKSQWNYYSIAMREGKLPDDAILRMGEGIFWHEMIQGYGVFDATEVKVRERIRLGNGDAIWIHGRADAVLRDAVWEFKKTNRIPSWKPKFEHALQISWYMDVMQKPKGRIVYIGYENGYSFDIKEIPWSPSEWHATQLRNRAITLHDYLKSKNPPLCSCRNRIHDIEWERYLEEKARRNGRHGRR